MRYSRVTEYYISVWGPEVGFDRNQLQVDRLLYVVRIIKFFRDLGYDYIFDKSFGVKSNMILELSL